VGGVFEILTKRKGLNIKFNNFSKHSMTKIALLIFFIIFSRLKNWINNKAELEKEQKEKRRKKLEKMVQEPKVEFKDSKYESARSDMTEKVSDALEQGLKASASTSGVKRPCVEKKTIKNKKKKIWYDHLTPVIAV